MRAVFALLAFASCALAYQVLTPNKSQGWTNSGAQTATWQKVNTDKQNFTVVLDNQNITGFSPQVLAALVDGDSGKTSLNPANGGWPTGSGFRLNFVQDEDSLSTIYAQSEQFDIKESTSTSSKSSSTPTKASNSATAATSSDNSTPTDVQNVPPNSGSAANSVHTGVLALFAVMAYALA